jgi:hypothetical protein
MITAEKILGRANGGRKRKCVKCGINKSGDGRGMWYRVRGKFGYQCYDCYWVKSGLIKKRNENISKALQEFHRIRKRRTVRDPN